MINLVLVMIRIGKVMILPCIFAGILVIKPDLVDAVLNMQQKLAT